MLTWLLVRCEREYKRLRMGKRELGAKLLKYLYSFFPCPVTKAILLMSHKDSSGMFYDLLFPLAVYSYLSINC